MASPKLTDPEWDRSALVVVDVQNDFVEESGAMPVSGTSHALPAMTDVASTFRATGRPIVHIVRLYVPGGLDTDLPRRELIASGARIAAPGSVGSQVPSVLLPHPVELDAPLLLSGRPQEIGRNQTIIFKPRWSAFHRTGLDGWLQDREVSTVVVLGCNLPNCPRATLFDASNHDYRTVLVTDATSQTSAARLDDLRLIGTNLMTSIEVIAALTDDENRRTQG